MKEEKNYLKRTLKCYSPYKGLIFLIFFFGAICTALSFVPIILTAKIATLLINTQYDLIPYYIIGIIITAVSTYFGQLLFKFFSLKLNNKVEQDLKNKAAQKMINISLADYYKKGNGTFVERLVHDTTLLGELGSKLTNNLLVFLKGLFQTAFIIILSPYYLIWALVEFLLLLFLMKIRATHFHLIFFNLIKATDESTNFFLNLINGFKEIKDLNLKSYMRKRASEYVSTQKETEYEKDKVIEDYNIIIYTGVADIGIVLFWLISLVLLTKGAVSLEELIIANNYLWGLATFFTGITEAVASCQAAETAAKRVFGIIDYDEVHSEKFGKKTYSEIKGKIELRNVSFGYDKKQLVLKNINLMISENSLTAFVGKSGEGKSTILNLISKEYDIQSGDILIDGHNLKSFTEDALRDNISVVSQTPYFFEASIIENLKMVNKHATKEEIITACKEAEIYDIITSKPDGFNTIIGPDTSALSGGQKQRLAIARALLKKSKIIIFDEATSALDNNSQEKIKKIILKLSENHTILMVAHRLNTVVDADKIVVIDNHQISGEGTHQQLLATNDVYRTLYEYER